MIPRVRSLASLLTNNIAAMNEEEVCPTGTAGILSVIHPMSSVALQWAVAAAF